MIDKKFNIYITGVPINEINVIKQIWYLKTKIRELEGNEWRLGSVHWRDYEVTEKTDLKW